MTSIRNYLKMIALICFFAANVPLQAIAKDIIRPERIQSKRNVVYSVDTYTNLAKLWKDYNKSFPSEDAYANWMYAARYAGAEKYPKLLKKGLKKYPSNPTLLYLSSMEHHGSHHDFEGLDKLERAARLDPEYLDPWFSLAINYMDQGDMERLDVALKHLLEGGAISETVMDYNYNMLACLEPNAVLITNGDNDTYPGWILQRILGFRHDVSIINRSLLNTDWYPPLMVKQGAPRFIDRESLDSMRTRIIKHHTLNKIPIPVQGPFSDSLIVRLIKASVHEKRPLYFAYTMMETPVIVKYAETGHRLGLATLVTPTSEDVAPLVNRVLETWLAKFRTGGLDSWNLRYARESDASKMLVMNYAIGQYSLLLSNPDISAERTSELFNWYLEHVDPVLPEDWKDKAPRMWAEHKDIDVINKWLQKKGIVN